MPLLLRGSTQLPGHALNLSGGRQPQCGKWAGQRQAWPYRAVPPQEDTCMLHTSHVCAWQDGWAQRS